PERRLARKELDAVCFRRKARGETCGAPGTVAGVGKFLRGKDLQQARWRRLAQQALDTRDRDGVDAAAVRRGGRVRHPRNIYDARTTMAALVPANPRDTISATGPVGTCGAAEMRSPAHSGSGSVKVAIPGTV